MHASGRTLQCFLLSWDTDICESKQAGKRTGNVRFASRAVFYKQRNVHAALINSKVHFQILFPLITQYKKKVKCTLVQALRLCTGRTAHRGSRGIALFFHDHGTSRGWGVSVTPRPLFTPGKDPVPIVQEAGWAPGPVWTGAVNLAPTGIRFPDRPTRSQSLYRLRHPAH